MAAPRTALEVVLSQQPSVEGGVDRRDGGTRLLAAHGLQKCVEDLDTRRSRMRLPMQSLPMTTGRARLTGQPRRGRRQVDVQRLDSQHEHVEMPERADARQPPTHATCRDHLRRSVRREVPAPTRTQQGAAAHGRGDRAIVPPTTAEVRTAKERGARLRVRHPATLRHGRCRVGGAAAICGRLEARGAWGEAVANSGDTPWRSPPRPGGSRLLLFSQRAGTESARGLLAQRHTPPASPGQLRAATTSRSKSSTPERS